MNKNYSVLMSIYYKENPDFFKTSIESMLNQTLKPNEIVIVKDGGLTEELDRVIDYYVAEWPDLFTVVPLEKNVGLGLALNEGLKTCRNELVARMDTDDISLPNRCERQVEEFIKNERLSIVGTMTKEFYDSPSNVVTFRIVPTKHEEIIEFSRRRSPFNHPTVMYRKSAVLGCEGGYHDIKRKEDIDLFGRMLHEGCIAMNISDPLLLFRSNEDNYKRRKSWDNCKSYIDVIYNFWRKGYCRTSDLIYVIIGQIIMYISPIWLFRIVSDNVLRKNIIKAR